MNEQELQTALVFMNRVTLQAAEIPAWNMVVSKLQELLRAAKEEAVDDPNVAQLRRG